MASKEKNMGFREEALEKFNSAELLDKNLVVIKPRSWILLAVVAGFLAAALVWGFLGHIPKQQEGMGIIIERKAPIRIASPSSTGVVTTCNAEPGQIVKAGEILLEVMAPEGQIAFDQAQKQYDFLIAQDKLDRDIEDDSLAKLRAAMDLQMSASESALTEATNQYDLVVTQDKFDSEMENKSLLKVKESTELQAQASRAALERVRLMIDLYTKQVEKYSELAADKAIPEPQLISIQAQLYDAEQKEKSAIASLAEQASMLEGRIAQVEMARSARRTAIERAKSELANARVSALATIGDLESRLQSQISNVEMSRSARQSRIESAESNLAQARMNHELNEVVRAPMDLRVIEVMVHEGDFVSRGMDVITAMAVEGEEPMPTDGKQVIAFVNFSLGMEIEDGMPVQVAVPFADSSQYGFIKGKVRNVATYASDAQSVAQQVGSNNLAQAIVQATGNVPLMVEIDVETNDETDSGFAWTSREGFPGDVPHLSGVSVKITTRYERPINLVLPWVKGLLGIDARPQAQRGEY